MTQSKVMNRWLVVAGAMVIGLLSGLYTPGASLYSQSASSMDGEPTRWQ